MYSERTRSIGGSTLLWQSLDYFPLVQVVRQSDISFSTTLTKIGSGEQLNTDEINMIQSRFRTREWCEDNLDKGVVRLFHTVADVLAYNSNAIPELETTEYSNALDTYTG